MTTKTPKITDLNLHALRRTFNGADEIKNGSLYQTDLYALRRCIKAGLIEVDGGRNGVIRLTAEGKKALGRQEAPTPAPQLEVVQRSFDEVEIEMVEGALSSAALVNPLLGSGSVPVMIRAMVARRVVEEKLSALGPEWACEWDREGEFAAIVKVAR